jgi:hypothetical protein
MTVARSPTSPHRVIYAVRRRLPPGIAGLAATIDALASLRASFHGWGAPLMHGALIATAVFAGWWALDRFVVHRNVTAEQQALESSALELATRALAPGSALPCLDGIAGDVVEDACEKAIFASPEATAAAVSYVAAQLSLLASAGDHVRRTAPRLWAAQLRHAIEADRFGIAAHILSVSGGCTSDQCGALALLHDASRVRANLAERPFDALIKRYAAGWPAVSNRSLVSNPPPATTTGAPGAAAKSVTSLYFPSSSSIPPINIMTAESAASPPNNTARASAAVAPPRKPTPGTSQMRKQASPKTAPTH